MIIEYAYAKINLTLNVIGKRSDGYHELESLMTPISLYDTLYFYDNDKDVIDGMNIKDNIIDKTIKLVKEKYNINKCVKIVIDKKIPLMAGLAGGSADSSATLRGLNRLWNLNLSLDKLMELSAILGSDNPFCIYNKLAIMKGRGEILEFVSFKLSGDVLIVKPNFGVSTKEIFANYKALNTPLNHNISNDNIMDYTYNDLESVTLSLYPKLKELFDYIIGLGYKVRMSGSGPSLYIIDEYNKLINLKENLSNFDCYINLCNIL